MATTFANVTDAQISKLETKLAKSKGREDRVNADLCRLALGKPTVLVWNITRGKARMRVAELLAERERAELAAAAAAK